MRAALFVASDHNSTVFNAFSMANYIGLNGEDRYTMLAYRAIKLAETLQESLLERASLSVSAKDIVMTASVAPYEQQPTMTLVELLSAISLAISEHGENFPVRVDTSYDQGQRAMPITGCGVRYEISSAGRPYFGIDA